MMSGVFTGFALFMIAIMSQKSAGASIQFDIDLSYHLRMLVFT